MFLLQMKLSVACLVILVFVHHHQTAYHVIGANTRLPFLVNAQTLQPSPYITVTGILLLKLKVLVSRILHLQN